GLVGAGLALRELPAHHPLQDVGTGSDREDLVGKRNRAGRAAIESSYLMVHHSASFAGAAGAAAPSRLLNAPGAGTPSGRARLTASRIVIQPPLAPGTAPSTMISPRATSVLTTLRFWVVTRTSPIWPAIFL